MCPAAEGMGGPTGDPWGTRGCWGPSKRSGEGGGGYSGDASVLSGLMVCIAFACSPPPPPPPLCNPPPPPGGGPSLCEESFFGRSTTNGHTETSRSSGWNTDVLGPGGAGSNPFPSASREVQGLHWRSDVGASRLSCRRVANEGQSSGTDVGPKSTGNTRRRRKLFFTLHWNWGWGYRHFMTVPPPPHGGDRPHITGGGLQGGRGVPGGCAHRCSAHRTASYRASLVAGHSSHSLRVGTVSNDTVFFVCHHRRDRLLSGPRNRTPTLRCTSLSRPKGASRTTDEDFVSLSLRAGLSVRARLPRLRTGASCWAARTAVRRVAVLGACGGRARAPAWAPCPRHDPQTAPGAPVLGGPDGLHKAEGLPLCRAPGPRPRSGVPL